MCEPDDENPSLANDSVGNDPVIFDGEVTSEETVYTKSCLTGKDSYTITVGCTADDLRSGIVCTAYQTSPDSREYLDGIVIGPGEKKTLTLTGLPKTAKIFLQFTGAMGVNEASQVTKFSAKVG